MKKNTSFTYKVKTTKSHPFPIDMLRYDSSIPATEVAAGVITETFLPISQRGQPIGSPVNLWEVELRYVGSGTRNSLTPARWESFGWELV